MMKHSDNKCPECSSALAAHGRFWFCEDCGYRELKDSDKWETLIETLPSHLALALQDYSKEVDPLLQLYRLCDFAELCLRFHAAIALGIIEQGKGIATHRELRATLSECLGRPTFGQWINITEKAKSLLDETDPNVPSGFIEKTDQLLRLVEMPGHKNEPKKSVKALRNSLAHDGRFEKTRARELLNDNGHAQRFHEFCENSGLFFESFRLVGISSSDQAVILRGSTSKHNCEESGNLVLKDKKKTLANSGDVFLTVESGPCLKLSPLLTFEPPNGDRRNDYKKPQEKQSDCALQIFEKLDENHVPLYSVFCGDSFTSFASKIIQERFNRKFPLSKWREDVESKRQSKASEAANQKSAQPYRFRDIKDIYQREDFVGRESELQKIEQWCIESKLGATIVFGLPGMGKTSLMLRALTQLKSCHKLRNSSFTTEHFFRSGDTRCSIQSLVRGLFYKMKGTGFQYDDFPSEADDSALCDFLKKALLEYLLTKKKGSENFKFIIVLDGLDELPPASSNEIIQFIKSFDEIGLLWILSSRPESNLLAKVNNSNIHSLFGNEGLPKLGEKHVRQLLLDELNPKQRYKFLREEDRSNQFLRELIAKAQGLPLYLKILLRELRSEEGKDYIDRPDTLPNGLDEYYTSLLDTNNLDPAKIILPDLIALLSLARTPLPNETIEQCFTKHHLRSGENWSKIFKEALRLGNTLTKKAYVWEGEQGLTLYHPSFREYLLQGEGKDYSDFPMGDVLRAARNSLESMCRDWMNYKEESYTRSYSIRHVINHLLDGGNPLQAYDLVIDLKYMEERLNPDTFFEFIADISHTARVLSSEPKSEFLQACHDVFERNCHSIIKNPKDTFQFLYNELSRKFAHESDARSIFLEAKAQWESIIANRKTYWICQLFPNHFSRQLRGHIGVTKKIIFSSDGNKIATVSFGKIISDSTGLQVAKGSIIVRTAGGAILREISASWRIPLAFGGPENDLLFLGHGREIEIWSIIDNSLVDQKYVREPIVAAISATETESAQFITLSGKRIRYKDNWQTSVLEPLPDANLVCADISQDGKKCLTVSNKGQVIHYCDETGPTFFTLPSHFDLSPGCSINEGGIPYYDAAEDSPESREGQPLHQCPIFHSSESEEEYDQTLKNFGRTMNPILDCSCDNRMVGMLKFATEDERDDYSGDYFEHPTSEALLWNADDPEQIETVWTGRGPTNLRINNTKKALVVATYKGDLSYLDLETKSDLLQIHPWGDPISAIQFSPDDKALASATEDLKIHALPLIDADRIHTSGISSCSYSSDGKRLATGGLDGRVVLWDSDKWPSRPLNIHAPRIIPQENPNILVSTVHYQEPVVFLKFTDDNKFFVSVGDLGSIALWQAETGRCKSTTDLDPSSICDPRELSVATALGGTRIAAFSNSRELAVWDITDEITEIFSRSFSSVDNPAVALSSCGQNLAVWHQNVISVFCLKSKQCTEEIKLTKGERSSDNPSFGFFGVGQNQLYGMNDEGVFRIWRIKDGSEIWSKNLGYWAKPRLTENSTSSPRIVVQRLNTTYDGDEYEGLGDLDALVKSPKHVPFRVLSSEIEHEVTVACRKTNKILARYNIPLRNLRMHPDGKTWTGSYQNMIYTFRLEVGPLTEHS
ncbi:hypothetical protein N9733_01475 [Akkermansiaceae bacterium]|nr:hypothetical protein [Akkermansiaceae bacterium]MDB4569641.1 hypothetical protein [Akkermansiaceae bacterium]